MYSIDKILEKAKELVAMLGEKKIKDKVELSTVAPGGVIELGGYEFVVLGHHERGTLVISKGFMEEDVKFGDNTDFNGSNMQRVLYEDILPKIEEVVGKDSILSVSPSGRVYYGSCNGCYGVRPVLYLKSNIFVSLGGKCDEK